LGCLYDDRVVERFLGLKCLAHLLSQLVLL